MVQDFKINLIKEINRDVSLKKITKSLKRNQEEILGTQGVITEINNGVNGWNISLNRYSGRRNHWMKEKVRNSPKYPQGRKINSKYRGKAERYKN